MKLTISLSLLLAFPVDLYAHHSRHEFGGEVRELEGELTRIMWFNPHVALMIEVADDTGTKQLWRIEAFGAPRTYEPAGITQDLFRVGDHVIIAGQASTSRPNYFLANNALLADGTEVILGGRDRRWTGAAVIGLGYDGASQAVDEEKLKAAAAENRGIFRVWSLSTRGVEQHLPFTAEALAGRERWDVANNPLARCEQPGMPFPMMNPVPLQFIDDGATIRLHSAYFDTVRTIHIADAENLVNQPATHLGHSVGRWEGRTLIVETTRVNYPYFNSRGTPQSPAVKFTERFALSEDQSRLDYHLTIIDPATFTEPATHERFYLALDQPFVAMDCKVF